jgi:hypothetical protein
MIDWFSFVGGFLGLFFGFSFLSAVEIIFHILRRIFKCKTHKRAKKLQIWRNFSRTGSVLSGIRRYFREFMTSSSIHSLSYIGDKNLKIIER